MLSGAEYAVARPRERQIPRAAANVVKEISAKSLKDVRVERPLFEEEE